MKEIYKEIMAEREIQDRKWGQQDHYPMEWLAILGEEIGEVNRAVLEAHFKEHYPKGSWENYRKELIQVAAVVVAMIECHDRVRGY
jgi:NTP pyrophosphatase (non-canonical NTP hydrolase)